MIEKNWQELQKPETVEIKPSEYNPVSYTHLTLPTKA